MSQTVTLLLICLGIVALGGIGIYCLIVPFEFELDESLEEEGKLK